MRSTGPTRSSRHFCSSYSPTTRFHRLRRWLGDSVVSALEKLMGLVLTAIAVEMILAGLKRYFMG